jgi:hypothetical protein
MDATTFLLKFEIVLNTIFHEWCCKTNCSDEIATVVGKGGDFCCIIMGVSRLGLKSSVQFCSNNIGEKRWWKTLVESYNQNLQFSLLLSILIHKSFFLMSRRL